MGILSLLIFFPLAGILILALYPASRSKDFRLVALGITLGQCAIFAGFLLPEYLAHPEKTGVTQLSGFHFVEHLDWIRMHLGQTGILDIHYTIGLDGLNFALIGLTVFIMLIAALSSWNVVKSPRAYFMLFLLLDISLLGCFSALDLFLFFLFFEFMLLPMFFLIGVWGYERKEYAAVKFYLFTLFGSLFLLLAIIGLAFSFVDPIETAKIMMASGPLTEGESVSSLLHKGMIDPSARVFSFGMLNMMRENGAFINLVPGSIFDPASELFGMNARTLGFLCVLIAFLVKIPSVPFHTWLPDAHVQAPTAVSVILAGVLLKIGGYGIIRIGLGVFPDAFPDFQFTIAILGWGSLIYGSFVAISQTDLKKLVAYSSVAHMGYVLLGIASGTATGLNGAILQMLAHGIVSAALFLIVGVISDRTNDRNIASYSGLWAKVPVFSVLVIFAFFASMEMPGLNAFIAELLVLLGLFQAAVSLSTIPLLLAITTVGGMILSAVIFLRPFRTMFFGAFLYQGNKDFSFSDINFREGLMLVPLSILMLLFGILPFLLTGLFDQSVALLAQYIGG